MNDERGHIETDDEAMSETLAGLRHEIDAELPDDEATAEILDRAPESHEIPGNRLKAAVPGIFGAGVDYDPDNPPQRKGLYQALIVIGALVVIAAGFILYNAVFAPLVTVPDLIGKTSTEAIVALNNQGLSLGTLTEKETAGVNDGVVLDQSPRVDSQLRKGSKVNVTVAKAGDTTVVPKLEGLTRENAEKALTDKRLTIKVAYTYNDSAKKGAIVGQLPVSGTVVPATSAVTVLINSGPYKNNISVPRVIGLSEDEAIKVLEARGFIADVTYASTSYGSKGEVVMQTPASKSSLSPRSVVQILVSKEMEGAKTAVPDVVGLSLEDAQKQLVNAGFSIMTHRVVDSSMPQGRVSAQTPTSEGSLLKSGETVSLLVSNGASSKLTVPNVLNTTLKQARDQLEALGFEVIVTGATSGSTAQKESYAVTQQFPAGQSAYNLGLPVLLYAPAQGQ